MLECAHHYDIGTGKNYYYFANPVTSKWQVHPWDVDLVFSLEAFGNGSEPFVTRVLDAHKLLRIEFVNRLREVLDLLFNSVGHNYIGHNYL